MAKEAQQIILLVEHDAGILHDMSDFLGKNGYNVIAARSGPEAVEMTRRCPGINLAMMDIDLGNGTDVMPYAEQISKERGVPVLFLYDPAAPEAVEGTERFPGMGYVAKGRPNAAFLACLKTAMRFSDTERRNRQETAELEAANRKLRDSEAELRSLFDAVPAGVAILGNRRFKKVNAAMCELFGYSEEEMLGQLTRILYTSDEEYQRIGRVLYADLRRTSRSTETSRFRKKDGSTIDVLIGASPLDPSAEDPMSGIASVVFDISNLKRMEENLRETQDFLYKSQEIGRVGSYVIEVSPEDSSAEIWRGTPMVDTIFGIGPEYPHTGKGWLDLIVQKDDIKRYFENLYRSHAARSDVLYQIVRPNDGAVRWIHGLGQLEYDEKGDRLRRVGTIQDITEQMNIQKDLDDALHEQETLFLELQHRVKNSFALIAGIVGLEAGRAEGGKIKEILDQLKDRVLSLASLYDLLFRSQNTTTVFLDLYIHSILESLSASFVEGMGRIRIEETLEPVAVSTKNSTAWGLMVNELVTNALKYAFPKSRAGILTIDLRTEGEDIVLSVSDDGIGLPSDFDVDAPSGLGLSLTSMMAEQLGGSLEFIAGNAKTFRIRAPKKKP